MVRRKSEELSEIPAREFTLPEIESGTRKLQRRVQEVQNLDPGSVRYDDAKIDNVEANIRETIRETFGPQSPEFQDHQYHRIQHGIQNMLDTDADRQAQFAAGIPQTITVVPSAHPIRSHWRCAMSPT